MKAKQITSPPKFTPVKIELEIESIDELKILWHRLNLSWREIETLSSPDAVGFPETVLPFGVDTVLWNIIDMNLKTLGEKL